MGIQAKTLRIVNMAGTTKSTGCGARISDEFTGTTFPDEVMTQPEGSTALTVLVLVPSAPAGTLAVAVDPAVAVTVSEPAPLRFPLISPPSEVIEVQSPEVSL